MPDDSFTQRTLETYLRRELGAGTRTREALAALSVEMFARCQDGTTITEISLGPDSTTRAQVSVHPQIVLAAVEAVLAATDPDNALANTHPEDRYANFSRGRIET